MPREGKSFSILLVEKDPDSVHLVRKSLQENRQFSSTVDHALSVDEAIEKLQKNAYHLLLVEAEMEEESGFVLLERMRELKLEMPFVLMMPVKDDRLVREAMRRGVADLLIKNENHFQELSEKLRQSYVKFHEERRAGHNVPSHAFDDFMAEADHIPSIDEAPKKTATRDELTGLYSHGYLHERVVTEFSRASRYGYPLSCVMIDIDNFKAINEDHGYGAGEELLKEAASLLFENSRLSDFVARYGGEEFCLVLPHVNYDGACEMGERLRKTFAEHRFLPDTKGIRLTISVGVSSYPEDNMTLRGDLIAFAAQAVYRSKSSGRNRVTLYRDLVPVLSEHLPELKISQDRIQDFQRRMMDIAHTSRRAYIEASKALIMALESKDRFTAGHAASCAKYSMQVAEKMGMTPDEAEVVHHAALLHDIGKICIPDHILLKTGRLTFAEYETMKQHTYLGYKILKPIKFLQEEAVQVLHHHEWFNGEGYPCRLKGSEIPAGARIISVIDSYDTMRHAGGRYKKTSTVEDTVNELIACSGVQFDPQVVQAFIEVLKERGELKTDAVYNAARLEEVIKTCTIR